MKILHLINSMITGGAESLLKDVIIGFHNQYPFFEQHLITLYGGGKMLDSINDLIKHKDLGLNNFNFILKTLELKRYIKDNKIDLVHAHLYDAMILSRLGVPKNVKLFYTYHTDMHAPKKPEFSKIRLIIDKITYSKKHYAIFVSQTVKNEILNVIAIKKAFLIPNFTKNNFLYSYKLSQDTGLKLISVGNLRDAKNYFFTLELFKKLKDINVSIDIYGSGRDYNKLNSYIETNNLKVKIFTNKKITSELLSGYDLFFMASIQEGMSIALIEALKTGLPALLSNIDSFKETAKDSAEYFELNNINDAEKKILHFINNKKDLEYLSKKTIEISHIYSEERYLNDLFKLYSTY